jgi:hypothetical protein
MIIPVWNIGDSLPRNPKSAFGCVKPAAWTLFLKILPISAISKSRRRLQGAGRRLPPILVPRAHHTALARARVNFIAKLGRYLLTDK